MASSETRTSSGSHDPNCWTLTPNDRLARILREDVNLALSGGDARVWEAPQIAPFSRWCIDQWASTWPSTQLLSVTQELVLWREAVERDEAGALLLAPVSAAREARKADQMVRQYQIDLDGAAAFQDEHRAFRRWCAHVSRRLSENDWLTAADIPGQTARLILSGAIAVPQKIVLAGYLEPPDPSTQSVLDALRQRGTAVEFREPARQRAECRRLRFEDEETQARFAAGLIRTRLAAHADNRTPPPRIIVAMPDPEAQRARLQSLLRELVAPWSLGGEAGLPWRWERGEKLSDQPATDALLAVLQLGLNDNPPQLLSRILLSAHLWSESERQQSARVDFQLRESGIPRIGLQKLLSLMPESLAPRVQEVLRLLGQAPARALPSEWADHFRRLLAAIAWPGSQALDSQSYQYVEAARDLLERLGTLDAQLGRVPMQSARDWLNELASSTRIGVRVEHLQAVLLTSISEAASLPSDLCLVLDATNTKFPGAARPTPLIALDAQRAAGVPEVSPEQQLSRARKEVGSLLSGIASEIIVCAPLVDGSGAELLPSPLFGAVSDWHLEEPPGRIGATELALSSEGSLCQWPEADEVPAVSAAELAQLSAGSGLFKDWFESPFFAMCRHRLGIRELPEPALGVDARVQGILIHAVLEDFWRAHSGSEALRALDSGALRNAVSADLDRQIAHWMPISDYGAATVRLERARALDLLLQWLNHERSRIDPFEVLAREIKANPVIAGLSLSLRLDRVDRVHTPFGPRTLVLDYKTGREAATKGWKSDRIKEPQLPLYASHAVEAASGIDSVDGICFGHIKDGHPALVALCDWRKELRKEPPADLSAHWQENIAQWQQLLDSAARLFLNGTAWLDPRVNARSNNAALLAFSRHSAEDGES